MFDNVALDVVIGLVFIYLLYSLLVTILAEWIATKLGIRARLLRIAVERMLNDGYYAKIEHKKKRAAKDYLSEKWFSILGWARKVLLYEPAEFKESVAGRFYQYPAIKYLSRIEETHKGRFSLTKPAYISANYFADTLIDFLKDKSHGTTEMEKIEFCLKFNTYHIQPKTLKNLKNLFEQSGFDKNGFKQNIIKWFDETMDRANGWHKRKMQLISFWLGFIIAIAFNLDTINITSKLSKDKSARDQLVQMSIQASDTTSALSKAIKRSADSSIKSDTVLVKGFKEINKAVDESRHILGLGWDKVKPEKVYLIFRNWSFTFYKQFHPFRKEFWGLILTALALSLGAPFWFDLLNKLVSIRGVGVKPEEKKQKGKTAAEQIETFDVQDISQKALPAIRTFRDNVDEAISIVSEQIYKIPGIKAIIRGNNGNDDFVQFNVADASTATIVKKDFPFIKVHGEEVKVIVVVSGIPKAHSVAGQIINETAVLGYGTLGCVVKDIVNNQLHILSCWHVMKGNEELEKDDVFIRIFNNNNEYIADRWGGGIYDCFDYGFAVCKDDTNLSNEVLRSELKISGVTIKVKPISDSDTNKRINVKLYDCIKTERRDGKIYSAGFPVEIDYDTGTTFFVNDIIVLTDTSAGDHKTLSDHGNSGTIVFDESNNAIAMIIAGDANYSYAIRLSKIFSLYPSFQII